MMLDHLASARILNNLTSAAERRADDMPTDAQISSRHRRHAVGCRRMRYEVLETRQSTQRPGCHNDKSCFPSPEYVLARTGFGVRAPTGWASGLAIAAAYFHSPVRPSAYTRPHIPPHMVSYKASRIRLYALTQNTLSC